MTLKPVLIIGLVLSCSITVLTIGLSIDKILVNQNNLEIEKEDLELVNLFQQEKLLSNTTEELIDSDTSVIFSNYLDAFSTSHSMKMNFNNYDNFDTYFTLKDFNLCKYDCSPIDGAKLVLNESGQKFIDILKPDDNHVVIYPLFTASAYAQPGFYNYFKGDCDESCITDLSFNYAGGTYNSSVHTAQILHSVGYNLITDVDVDKNPEILKNYEKIILLHNEYVTKKMFDAIVVHPNVIFLFPNALYAEIDVNYDTNTMSLIRGHDYPTGIKNGFDYLIEEQFHKYEYDNQCLEWEFIKIKNGYHLNCYPDSVIHKNFDILLKLKDL
jgi:hypothetical protein